MKIDDDFKVVCLGPINSFEEVIVLSLDVRFARTDIVSPIAYRDAHVIESIHFLVQSVLGWCTNTTSTNPASAIAVKSSCVIQVSQC